LSNFTFAQKGYDQAKEITYNANIANTDSSVRAEVYYETNKKIKIEQNVIYYWFYINRILSTQGGFEGRLLNGTYNCFYPDNNLKEKGEFKDGQKTGKWTAWYITGKIKETAYWKKSSKNRINEFFDKDGNMTLKANYKNGKLNGNYIVYKDGKQVSLKKYKDGKELEVKIKSDTTSFFKKIFKRKNRKDGKLQVSEKPQNNPQTSDAVKADTKKQKEDKKKAKKNKEIQKENTVTSKEKKSTDKEDKKKKSKKEKDAVVTPDVKK